jgi:GNAT superfamily N-acetyltransferase
MIKIIDYTDAHASFFKQLNLEWLDKYGLTEPADLLALDDPWGYILDKGGCIFLAADEERVVGTAAIMNEGEAVFELAKMSVSPKYQGKGISKMLIEKCLSKARELKAKKIILFSNSQLLAALHLYRRYGFADVEVTGSPFVTADIKMELIL